MLTTKPFDVCYADALKRTITKTEHIRSLRGIVESVNDHRPVVIGMEVYEGFMTLSSHDALVPMPAVDEEYLGSFGGHSVTILGYSIPKRRFLIKNSFGTDWGDKGYGWLSFEYVNKFVFERWCFDISDQTTLIETSPMSYNTSNNETVSDDIT